MSDLTLNCGVTGNECGTDTRPIGKPCTCPMCRAAAELTGSGSELSADAPAQPPQICDDARALLDEAIAALEPACTFAWTAVVADCEEARAHLNDIINNQRATLAKLRAARNG